MGAFATPRAKWRGRLPCARHVLDRFGRPPSKTRPKQNGPSSPASFSLARAAFWPLAGATSLFPAKREVKREVAKVWLAWPGNQTSSRSLVRSLVWPAGRGGGREAARGDLRPPSRPLWWHWGKQSSRRPLEKKKKAQNGDISKRGNTSKSTNLLFWGPILGVPSRFSKKGKMGWGEGGRKFWVCLPRPERNGGVGSPARGTC